MRQPLVKLLGLALLALSLMGQPAHAQAAPTPNGVDTSSFFSVPPWDKSNELLGIIFGDAWFKVSAVKPDAGTPSNDQVGLNTGSGGDSGILGAMSKILNAACMLVAVVIVVFATTTGVMHTAHEGVALGKKYSTLWFPLRSALAMAALAPLAGGYSMIQVTAFQATKVSIGIANTVYSEMIQYMGSGAPFGMAQVPEGKDLAEGLFRANACKLFLDKTYATMGYGPAITKNVSAAPSIQNVVHQDVAVASGGNLAPTSLISTSTISFDGSPMSGYTNAVCGRVSYTTDYAGVQSGAKSAYIAQRWAAVLALDKQMDTLAAAILNGESFTAHADDFYNAVQAYHSAVLAAGAAYQSQIAAVEASTGGSTRAAAARDSLSQGGWIYAGSFYWQMQNSARKLSDVLEGKVSISAQPQDGIGPAQPPALDEGFKQYEMGPVQRIALYLKQYAINPLTTGDAAGQPLAKGDLPHDDGQPTLDSSSAFKSFISAPFLAAVRGIQRITDDPKGDALEKMAEAGHYLIDASEAGYVAMVAADAVAAGANASALGLVGNLVSGVPQAAKSIIHSLDGPLKLLLLVMLLAGVWASLWLPAVPFIMWIMACTGWIIAVVQSVISAPIWAAAHAVPEGDGFAGQQARNGYMMIISLMLRPTLMLFGMIGGMLVMQAAGVLVWLLFPAAVSDMVGDSVFGAVSFVTMMVLLLTIMSSAAHRSLELAYGMGDQILKWIGGGVEQLGAQESTAHAQRTFVAAFSRVSPMKAPKLAASAAGAPPAAPKQNVEAIKSGLGVR